MAFLRIFHEISNYVASAIGLLFNSFIIYVIIKASNIELKKYSKILLQSTVFDIWLNAINIMICPILIITHNSSVIPLNPMVNIGKHFQKILFGSWILILYSSMFTISMAFYFRYRVLCLNKKFTIKVHLICLLISECIGALYAINVYYGFCLRTEDKFYMAEKLAPWFGDKNGRVDTVGITGTVSFFLGIAL